jgi:hypothetical protein
MNNCKIKLCGGKIQLPPTYVPVKSVTTEKST